MLTGLDFPLDLLYGEDGLWVRDDGAGSVRVGLHFYVLEREEPVVHVHLPRPGTVVLKGETIGHIDLGSSTFSVVAPVSGTVFLPNPDLRDDSDLIRMDGFGAGYLLDLDDVEGTDVDALMEPDEAMAFYSRFEVEGVPRGSMLVEPDRPWFTSMTYGYGDTIVARARILPPLSNEVFAPDWTIGQTWSVQTSVGGVERQYDYEVLGEAVMAGEAVWRIEAVERSEPALSEQGVALSPPPISRRLYFRLASFTLMAWDAIPSDNPTLFKRHWNERGEAAYTRFDAEDGFFCDHPFIPPGRMDMTRDLPETAQLPALVDHYRFRGGGTRCEAEFRAALRNESGYEERFFSQQIWIAGDPWWTQAVRMRGDKVMIKAKLVTDER